MISAGSRSAQVIATWPRQTPLHALFGSTTTRFYLRRGQDTAPDHLPPKWTLVPKSAHTFGNFWSMSSRRNASASYSRNCFLSIFYVEKRAFYAVQSMAFPGSPNRLRQCLSRLGMLRLCLITSTGIGGLAHSGTSFHLRRFLWLV